MAARSAAERWYAHSVSNTEAMVPSVPQCMDIDSCFTERP